jgi:hypothetical protein
MLRLADRDEVSTFTEASAQFGMGGDHVGDSQVIEVVANPGVVQVALAIKRGGGRIDRDDEPIAVIAQCALPRSHVGVFRACAVRHVLRVPDGPAADQGGCTHTVLQTRRGRS